MTETTSIPAPVQEATSLDKRVRHACINDLPIAEADRKFHWPLGGALMDTSASAISGFKDSTISLNR